MLTEQEARAAFEAATKDLEVCRQNRSTAAHHVIVASDEEPYDAARVAEARKGERQTVKEYDAAWQRLLEARRELAHWNNGPQL